MACRYERFFVSANEIDEKCQYIFCSYRHETYRICAPGCEEPVVVFANACEAQLKREVDILSCGDLNNREISTLLARAKLEYNWYDAHIA